MSQSQQVVLAVNNQRLVRNLRYSFTRKETLIAELMQNARRAGATQVTILYDVPSQILTVEDNGCGIRDFQRMLTVAESGWDEATKAEEHPFGMGFFSALFNACRVEISSLGKQMDFVTADALAFETLAVQEVDEYIRGARIRLIGLSMSESQIAGAVKRYSMGFPIPVSYNGQQQSRPHALDQGDFQPCSIGQVHMTRSASYTVYLQGIQVHRSNHYHHFGKAIDTIIHLDNTFRGRMPDRDSLVDEAVAIERIRFCLKELWIRLLTAEKAQMSAEDFTGRYWRLARSWGLSDVFTDVPYLPAAALLCISETPHTVMEDEEYLTHQEEGASLEQVRNGSVVLCDHLPDDEDDHHWPAATLADLSGWKVVRHIPVGHWSEAHTLSLASVKVSVDFEPLSTFRFNGERAWCDVILCDSYTLRSGNHQVEVRKQAVFLESKELLIPSGSVGVEALRQVSTYAEYDDKSSLDDNALQADTKLLSDRVLAEFANLRGEGQADTLAKVLEAGNLAAFSVLKDCAFIVRLDAQLRPNVLELSEQQFQDVNQLVDGLMTASIAQ